MVLSAMALLQQRCFRKGTLICVASAREQQQLPRDIQKHTENDNPHRRRLLKQRPRREVAGRWFHVKRWGLNKGRGGVVRLKSMMKIACYQEEQMRMRTPPPARLGYRRTYSISRSTKHRVRMSASGEDKNRKLASAARLFLPPTYTWLDLEQPQATLNRPTRNQDTTHHLGRRLSVWFVLRP